MANTNQYTKVPCHWHDFGQLGGRNVSLCTTHQSLAFTGQEQCVSECAELVKAARAAATSLETISRLAGRKTYGDPPIKTFMDSFMDVRLYAAARARAAREDIAAALPPAPQES